MRADGCAGCVARSGRVGGRELGAGVGARRQAGARSAGARGALAGARQGERARGWDHGAHGARPAGSTGAQPVRAGWVSWARLGFCAPGLVFSLVFRLGIFPESLNEHCSL